MKENLKFIVFIVTVVIFSLFIITNTIQQQKRQLALERKQQEEQFALEQELREMQAEEELKQNLQKELEFLNKPFRMTETYYYNAGWSSIKSEVESMNERAKMIQNGLDSYNTEIQNLAKAIRPKAIAYQLKAFPILRKAFAKGLNKQLWLEDAKTYVSGKDNIYINFVSLTFVRNRMIHEFHLEAYKMLTTLRFRQARYRYYDDGEYIYYTVYEGKDADLEI